jgi:hypothetical protein
LQALEIQRDKAIAEAEIALANDDFDILESKMDLLSENKKAKVALLEEISEAALEREEEIREQKSRIEREQAIVDLISSGVVDKGEIFTQLNASNPGSVSLDDIGGIVDELAPGNDFELRTVGKQVLRVNKGTGEVEVIFTGAGGGGNTLADRLALLLGGGQEENQPISKEEFRQILQDERSMSVTEEFLDEEYSAYLEAFGTEIGTPIQNPNLDDFTDRDLLKLEQAGKLNAPRQEQLDFLFGSKDTSGFSLSSDVIAEALDNL